jgi:hypothetical protein
MSCLPPPSRVCSDVGTKSCIHNAHARINPLFAFCMEALQNASVLCCALRTIQTMSFKIQGSQCLFQGFGVSLKRTLLCLAVNIGGPPKCGNSFGPPPKCGEICCGWPLRFAHRMKNASSERLCTKTKLSLQKKAFLWISCTQPVQYYKKKPSKMGSCPVL